MDRKEFTGARLSVLVGLDRIELLDPREYNRKLVFMEAM